MNIPQTYPPATPMMTGGATTIVSAAQSIFTFFFLCMNGWILYYINSMRSRCKHCASQWHVIVIMVILASMLLYILLSIFQKMPAYMNMVFFVLWAFFVALTLRFIYTAKESKCKCAKERNMVLMEQFMYINAALLVIVILIAAVISSKS